MIHELPTSKKYPTEKHFNDNILFYRLLLATHEQWCQSCAHRAHVTATTLGWISQSRSTNGIIDSQSKILFPEKSEFVNVRCYSLKDGEGLLYTIAGDVSLHRPFHIVSSTCNPHEVNWRMFFDCIHVRCGVGRNTDGSPINEKVLQHGYYHFSSMRTVESPHVQISDLRTHSKLTSWIKWTVLAMKPPIRFRRKKHVNVILREDKMC